MARNKLHPIPHPPRTPLLGNMLTVDGGAPVQDLMRIAREQGPIFWLDMMGTPLVVVSGADLVAELCDEKRFDKAVRGSLRRVRMLGGDALFTAETQEPNWQKAHNILLPTFAHRMMQTYHEGMLDIADQLVTKWERLNADEEIDVVRDMTALTLDTIGLCGFNYRFNSFYRSDNHPYVESLVRALEAVMKMRGLPLEDITQRKSAQEARGGCRLHERHRRPHHQRAPRDAGRRRSQARPAGLHAGGHRQADRRAARRRQYPLPDEHLPDRRSRDHERDAVLRRLLPAQQSRTCCRRPTRRSTACSGRDVNAKPTAQQVNQLVYIGQILKESLRLWPTAPAFGLYPYENETIGEKYKLQEAHLRHRADGRCSIATSRSGDRRPEVFNPDNFAPEREAKMPRHAYKPFGNGQRACIGRQFAMTEATLVLGMILQRFKLVDHTRYQLKIKESLTIKPDGLDDAGPAAARHGARQRPGGRHGNAGAARSAKRKAAASHGTQARRAVRLEHGHRRGTGALDRRGCRGRGLRHDPGRPRRHGGPAADRRRRGHRLRVLQRWAARQCRQFLAA